MPGRTAVLGLLYGVRSKDPAVRPADDLPGYDAYLDGMAEHIRSILPDLVILCGGVTNPATPLSEAASVLPYLQERVGIPMGYALEKKSENTRGNIYHGLIEVQKDPQITKLVVICDSLRVAKV